MLLQDWLAREGLTFGQFGSAIARSAEAVRRYANGDRIPDRETMAAIVRETGGSVVPNDFYGVTAHEDEPSAIRSDMSPGKSADFAADDAAESAPPFRVSPAQATRFQDQESEAA